MPYIFDWPFNENPPTGFTWLQVTATDRNGSAMFPPTAPASPIFNQFLPGTLTVTCNPPSTGNGQGTSPWCALLDNASFNSTTGFPGDIVNDSPSPTVTQCGGGATYAYSGFADPSMRVDPLASSMTGSNPWGTNLWMLYSRPKFQRFNGGCPYTPAVETHLAQSNTMSFTPGGTNFAAYCPGGGCPNPNPPTPIWPSTYVSTCTVGGYNGSCFTSNEVPNFWIYPNYPSAGSETTYAVHLFYDLPLGTGNVQNYIQYGCLVVSMVTGPPTNLQWITNLPTTCAGTTTWPTDNGQVNIPIPFNYLTTTLAGLNSNACTSWGEPAIMVYGKNGLPPSSTNPATVFLAAECFMLVQNQGMPQQTVGQGYWIFTTDLDLGQDIPGCVPTFLNPCGWSLYQTTQFKLTNLPPVAYAKYHGENAQFLTEFDWAQRPDGSLVALVTPAGFDQSAGTPLPFPCLAVDLNLNETCTFGTSSCPLTEVEATINDAYPDPGNGIYELYGPNGCTYDPNSNTGVLIVRHVLNSTLNPPTLYQTWWLMGTGVLP